MSSGQIAADLVEFFDKTFQFCILSKPDGIKLTDVEYREQSLAFVFNTANLVVQRSKLDSSAKYFVEMRFMDVLARHHGFLWSEVEAINFFQKSWEEFLPATDAEGMGVFPGFIVHFFSKIGIDMGTPDAASAIGSLVGITMSVMGTMVTTADFLNDVAPIITVTE